jgi:1,4-dihydroxy-2-naphthoate polyprenyltransferase
MQYCRCGTDTAVPITLSAMAEPSSMTEPSAPGNIWITGARPRTLPAAIVPVAIGAGCAAGLDDQVWWRVLLCLVVSLNLQVGVNYANDYSDGVRGTDAARVGPVRLVASGLAAPAAVKRAAMLSFLVAALAGLVLALLTSLWLLVVGVLAILAAWFYTGGPKPYGYLGLGELFVFVFFGLVATVGTTYGIAEEVTALSIVMGCAAGALACALLVINNLRDIPTDRLAGKRTLAVRLGAARTRALYVALIASAFVLGIVASIAWRPWTALVLIAMPVAVMPIVTVVRGAAGRDLIAVLGATGRVQMVYGVFATVGLVLSR